MLIITTPHRGLFGWLDHANYLPALRRQLALRLPGLFARVQRARHKPVLEPSGYEWTRHRHYSLEDFRRLFASTDMADSYSIDRVRRSGPSKPMMRSWPMCMGLVKSRRVRLSSPTP